MGNKSLSNAKREKNDEFYTQFSDIEKEVAAYLEYDADTFRGKVVYCNCDDPYESHFFRYFVLNFKKLGLKRLLTTSYKPSPVANTQLALFGNDDPRPKARGRLKVTANKFVINKVNALCREGEFSLKDVAEQLQANQANEWAPLQGDGDFRSEECLALLQEADIVVTNPPFSLFREYVQLLVDYKKLFLIVGNKSAITYKEIFPLIMTDKLWTGVTGFSSDMLFLAPANTDFSNKPATALRNLNGLTYLRSPSIWFTNLDHGRRHKPLSLMSMADNFKFSRHAQIRAKKKYEKYDNYDAIEVPFVDAIPSDFKGVMGVPISFLDKYNPEQFEIVGLTKTWFGAAAKKYPTQIQVNVNGTKKEVSKLNDGATIKCKFPPSGQTYYVVGVSYFTQVYPRVLVRHKRLPK